MTTPGTPATGWPSPYLVRVAAEALYGGPLDPDTGSVDDVCACHNAKAAALAVLRIAADDVAAREAAAERSGAHQALIWAANKYEEVALVRDEVLDAPTWLRDHAAAVAATTDGGVR